MALKEHHTLEGSEPPGLGKDWSEDQISIKCEGINNQ